MRVNCMKRTQRKRKTDKIHYFILRGYDQFRDGDEWIGIYHSRDEARDVYYKVAGELEKEHQEENGHIMLTHRLFFMYDIRVFALWRKDR